MDSCDRIVRDLRFKFERAAKEVESLLREAQSDFGVDGKRPSEHELLNAFYDFYCLVVSLEKKQKPTEVGGMMRTSEYMLRNYEGLKARVDERMKELHIHGFLGVEEMSRIGRTHT